MPQPFHEFQLKTWKNSKRQKKGEEVCIYVKYHLSISKIVTQSLGTPWNTGEVLTMHTSESLLTCK